MVFDSAKFSQSIRKLRKAENKTVTELALLVDINYSDLSQYELNHKAFRTGAVINLCNYFNLSISEFLCDDADIERSYYMKKIKSLLDNLNDDTQFLYLRKALDFIEK